MERIRNYIRIATHNIIRRLITSRLEEIPFVIFASFLVTFLVTRFYVWLTHKETTAFLINNVEINGIHIHHLNFGIFLLAIVGFWSLYDIQRETHRTLAIFYGIGLAWTFDEFALWLHLNENYYARASYYAIIFISAVLLSIIYFPRFWRIMKKGILFFLRPVLRFINRGS